VTQFDTILLSHEHLDHGASASVMISALSFGQPRKKVKLLAPRAVFNSRAVTDYFSNAQGQGFDQVVSHVMSVG
jgi:phosphoribosyl 1,2-cyclic phosphodiesterase